MPLVYLYHVIQVVCNGAGAQAKLQISIYTSHWPPLIVYLTALVFVLMVKPNQEHFRVLNECVDTLFIMYILLISSLSLYPLVNTAIQLYSNQCRIINELTEVII